MDTNLRSLIKSISWRLIGIVLLGLISYWITNNLKEMTIITLIFHSIRFVLYYFHERIWEHISWGKYRSPLCKIHINRNLSDEEQRSVQELLSSFGLLTDEWTLGMDE